MKEWRFHIDEEKYDDRHGQVLILSGWVLPPEQASLNPVAAGGGFCLYGDGKILPLEAPERLERPDVWKALEPEKGPEMSGSSSGVSEPEKILPGFLVRIPEAPALAKRYSYLELTVEAGEEKVSLWKKSSEELQVFLKESLVEYHLDRVEILYDSILEIQGWVIDQRGEVRVSLKEEDGSPAKARTSRGRRPDVAERRGLDKEYRSMEIGFRISASLSDIRGTKVLLVFVGDSVEKRYEIDIKEMRRELKKKQGGFLRRLLKGSTPENGSYEAWRLRHIPDRRELKRQRRETSDADLRISIVVPLYCTPLPYLKELVDSVRGQTYTNWELCLADGSPDGKAGEFIRQKYGREKRILYKKLGKNGGISENTNAAIETASGGYLMLCDHDDILEPDALYEIAKAAGAGADMVYTDEDKVSMDGIHYFDPNFKPDFNLFRLRDNNYICHIFAVKKSLADEAGYLRPEFDGAQDFDFILRVCERAARIIHVPKVLYHWRCHMNSTAADPESKAYAYEAGRRAVEEHYRRLNLDAEVERTKNPGWYRSRVRIAGNPLISIIIPNKDHTADLEKCLSSIAEKSTWKNYEILVVENNSSQPETFAYYEKLPEKYPKARLVIWPREFNYSAINNFAAKQAAGEYLLFLNNDTEVITPDWMEEMLMLCQQEDVGGVGAKLYYPDDTIQHAGVVLGLGGIAGHILCGANGDETGYCGRLISVQEVSAVTAACMMVRAADFEAAGGFDEAYAVAFNDIDLCMKLRAVGRKIVFTPYAELYHYESKSRGLEDTPEKEFRFEKEISRFKEKWKDSLIKGDPYYNPNLSVTEGDCSLRV